MNDVDYFSFRRNYMEQNIERWTSYCHYSDDVVLSDVILINWNCDIPYVFLFSNSHSRIQSEEYIGEILGLFEDVTNGEGNFVFEKYFVVEPCDYYPEELLKLVKLIK